jgi:thioester reductase-like protein
VRNVLLTGGTGTIGSALVPRLLADPDTSIRLLIRARDDGEMRQRLSSMQAHWAVPPVFGPSQRISAMRGDISLPDFGLCAGDHARVVAETSHIIHCAASVNLLMPIEQARATAVTPTRTVLELARLGARIGALRKVDLVSTVGVWGRMPGRMPERRLPEVSEFHNTYEAAKAEAERVIWAEGDGLPITVHRPSMVVGETETGRVINFQVFYHLCEFLSGARTFGIIPTLGETRLDIIPVDWVARAIDWSSRHEETSGRIFHLCSGPDDAIGLLRLQARVRSAWQQHGRHLPTLHRVPRRLLEIVVPLIGAVAGAKSRRALRALPPVLSYLAEDQGFSNEESARTFSAAGLPVPRVDSYLEQVLTYYLESRAHGTRA